MSINMILATGLNGELGQTSSPNGLPWKHNPDDMKMFRELTTGNIVVYGGNTFRQFQKMGMEYGLPNRMNWVLTSDKNSVPFSYNLCSINSLDKLKRGLELYKGTEHLWIIGGKSIYEQLNPYCDKVYLTRINQDFPEADVKISLDFLRDFDIIERIPLNDYSEVEVWQRKK